MRDFIISISVPAIYTRFSRWLGKYDKVVWIYSMWNCKAFKGDIINFDENKANESLNLIENIIKFSQDSWAK